MQDRDTQTPGATAYRDPAAGLESRRRDLLARRERQWSRLAPVLVSVYVRRARRIAFGAAASLGGVVMFALGLGAFVGGEMWEPPPAMHTGTLTFALLGSWALGALAWAAAGPFARVRLTRVIRRGAASTGDLWADVARLEAETAVDTARARIARLAAPSVAWPLVAIGLLAPLTIHFAVFFAVTGGSDLTAFDEWLRVSVILVGHCHVYVVYRSWLFAYREGPRAPSATSEAMSTLGRATALSAVPGLLLLLIPTALVGATGMCFLGPAFRGCERLAGREADRVASAVELAGHAPGM